MQTAQGFNPETGNEAAVSITRIPVVAFANSESFERIAPVPDHPTTSKLCVNCRWFGKDFIPRCTAPVTFRDAPDLVNGGTVRKQRIAFCSVHRDSGSDDCCGPEGKFFEPAEVAS